jgi:uncharacterized repeat protein (TIGR01451 family)
MKKSFPTFCTALILIVCLCGPANLRAVDFAAAKSYSVGSTPIGITFGDFNGDGKQDIAVADGQDVSILLGNGDGTFQPAANYSAGNSPSAIAIGDFNGDGKLDLAAFEPAGNAGNGSVSILLGNGDGTFQSPKTLALGAAGLFMAVSDFNLDKKSDLAIGNSANVYIYVGNGDGTFQAAKESSTFEPDCVGLVAADFNGDSKPDLALVSNGVGIQILLGVGDGTFTKGTVVTATVGYFDSAIAVDLRKAGKMDLLAVMTFPTGCVLNSGCTGFSTEISVFLGNGDGSFQAEQFLAGAAEQTTPSGKTGFLVGSPIFGDFNGDGKLDLAYRLTPVNSSLNPSLRFLVGNGDGSYSPTDWVVPLPGTGTGPVAQDLNGDKLTDLIAGGASNDVDVWLNNSPSSGTDLGVISPGFSPTVTVGSNLTFTVDVVNLGPQPATGVAFTDTLPNNTNFVSANATTGNCVQSHGIVSCSVGSLASGFASKVSIVLTPTAVGAITNSMSVTGNEADPNLGNNSATQTVNIVTAANFTLSAASATLTTQTGAQVTDVLTLAEQNGFSGQVNLSCAVNGPSPLAMCDVSPSSVTVGSSPGSSTLTITAPSSLNAFAVPRYEGRGIASFAVVLLIPSLMGISLGFGRSRKRRIGLRLLRGSLVAIFLVFCGCGGGHPPPPKSYMVTVTAKAASGSQQHTATVSVTVQ